MAFIFFLSSKHKTDGEKRHIQAVNHSESAVEDALVEQIKRFRLLDTICM